MPRIYQDYLINNSFEVYPWFFLCCIPVGQFYSFLTLCRKASAPKPVQQSTDQLSRTSISLASPNEVEKNIEGIAENEESLLPMIVGNSFIDAKVLWVLLTPRSEIFL